MKLELYHGDCLRVMANLLKEGYRFHSIVTDPPYELGFMGKSWDKSGVAFNKEVWALAYKLLIPGGHLLAFGGSRTYHRMVCAIEDAGFEIRDQIMWLYGTGFPKSLNVSRAIDLAAGVEREIIGESNRHGGGRNNVFNQDDFTNPITAPSTDEAKQWQGWGTALKPAHEPIVLARKPLAASTVAENVVELGVGGLNIDECRVQYISEADKESATPQGKCTSKSGALAGSSQHDGNRSEHDRPELKGRFPANVVHDGSEEVEEAFAEFGETSKTGNRKDPQKGYTRTGIGIGPASNHAGKEYTDCGTASRFFYCAKASSSERNESKHPTVKPLALMKWLVRMVTPPDGVVLDPFAGTATTGVAAKELGFDFVGIELNHEHFAFAKKRLGIVEPNESAITPSDNQSTTFAERS
jgi:DNA modification methylase